MSDKDQRKVPLLRFKGFTNDWEQRKLKDTANFAKGIGYSKKDLKSSGIPIILYGRLYTKYETVINEIDTFTQPKKDTFLSKGGEIIVPASGETAEDISVASVVKNKGIILGGDLNIVYPNSSLNSVFLALNITYGRAHDEMRRRAQGKTIVHLHNSDLANIKLKIPTISEQKKIVYLLEKINKLIALQQQKNADIINLKKAILDKIFSNSNIQKWRDIRLNKVLSIPVDEPKEVTNIDDIISVKLNTQGISKIPNRSTLKLGSTKYYVRHGGQFIFGKQNFFNGSMAIIPSEYDGKVSSKDVPSLNINKDIVMPYFLWLYLSRPSFYKKTERWATGTGSKRLHIKDLLSLKIYIPNKNEQLRICKLMRSLDTQILKSQKHLKELQSIKKFLLQNMFI